MDKITFSEALKMCQATGHAMWHIKWYPPLERKYPDCSHFVVQAFKDWRDPKGHLAVVIHDRKAEIQHQLRQWKREGRDHPMREFLEEELAELEAESEQANGNK